MERLRDLPGIVSVVAYFPIQCPSFSESPRTEGMTLCLGVYELADGYHDELLALTLRKSRWVRFLPQQNL